MPTKTKTKTHAKSKRPRSTRAELIIETLAEMALGDLSGFLMRTRIQDANPSEALSDTTRARLIEAATTLADVELDNPHLWESHDWRDTCDWMSAVLNSGRRVDRATLAELIPCAERVSR